MKRRKVTISFVIPAEFKWVATQPWGEIVAFKTKPAIYRAVEDQDGDFTPEYWGRPKQGNELSLVDLPESIAVRSDSWRRSLQKLK